MLPAGRTLSERQGPRQNGGPWVPALTVALTVLGIATGCGASSDGQEKASMPSLRAERKWHPPPPAAAVAVDTPTWNHTAALIRAKLAERYVYESWYTSIRAIRVRAPGAIVMTSLPVTAGGARRGRQVCDAILGFHLLTIVEVRFQRGSPLVCR